MQGAKLLGDSVGHAGPGQLVYMNNGSAGRQKWATMRSLVKDLTRDRATMTGFRIEDEDEDEDEVDEAGDEDEDENLARR